MQALDCELSLTAVELARRARCCSVLVCAVKLQKLQSECACPIVRGLEADSGGYERTVREEWRSEQCKSVKICGDQTRRKQECRSVLGTSQAVRVTTKVSVTVTVTVTVAVTDSDESERKDREKPLRFTQDVGCGRCFIYDGSRLHLDLGRLIFSSTHLISSHLISAKRRQRARERERGAVKGRAMLVRPHYSPTSETFSLLTGPLDLLTFASPPSSPPADL